MRATLLGEAVADSAPKGYQERKVALKCTRSGCDAGAGDESNECPKHHMDSKKRKRRYRRKMRKLWAKKRLCLRDGRKRRKGSKWCHRCLVKAGKLRIVEQDKQRDNEGDRVTRQVEGDGYARTRRHGQSRRGQQPWHQLNDQDLVDAIELLQRARQGLALAASAEVAQMPKVQRDDIKDAACAHAAHAKRFIAEVFARCKYDDSPLSEMIESAAATRR